jgi:hypothetical protein
MYRTILVAKHIAAGQRVLEGLQAQSSIDITAAFWFYFKEEAQWRLTIVSPEVATRGPRFVYTMLSFLLYGLAHDPSNPVEISLDQIRALSPSSLLYEQVKLGRGLIIARGPIRDLIGEDAYVYWI